MANEQWSLDLNLGGWTPEPVFPLTVQIMEQRQNKSAEVYPTFCKGRVCCVREMPTFRSLESRVPFWVKVSVLMALWTMPPDHHPLTWVLC